MEHEEITLELTDELLDQVAGGVMIEEGQGIGDQLKVMNDLGSSPMVLGNTATARQSYSLPDWTHKP